MRSSAFLQNQEYSRPNCPETTSRLPIYIFPRPIALKRSSACTAPVHLSNEIAQTYNHPLRRRCHYCGSPLKLPTQDAPADFSVWCSSNSNVHIYLSTHRLLPGESPYRQ